LRAILRPSGPSKSASVESIWSPKSLRLRSWYPWDHMVVDDFHAKPLRFSRVVSMVAMFTILLSSRD